MAQFWRQRSVGAGSQPHVPGRPPVRIATLPWLELRGRTRSHALYESHRLTLLVCAPHPRTYMSFQAPTGDRARELGC
jgi:hypothetical protein